MKRLNQSGSHILALGLLLLVLGVVGFTGYKVARHSGKPTTNAVSTVSSKAPATIQTKADLSATAKALDTASANVNSSVNSDALNTELNDLL